MNLLQHLLIYLPPIHRVFLPVSLLVNRRMNHQECPHVFHLLNQLLSRLKSRRESHRQHRRAVQVETHRGFQLQTLQCSQLHQVENLLLSPQVSHHHSLPRHQQFLQHYRQTSPLHSRPPTLPKHPHHCPVSSLLVYRPVNHQHCHLPCRHLHRLCFRAGFRLGRI